MHPGYRLPFFGALPKDSDLLSRYQMPSHFLLYSIDASGGAPRRMLDFPVSTFSFSPDGSQLLATSAYEDPAHGDPSVVLGKKAPLSAAYLVNLATGRQRRVTGFGQHCQAAWSPDGSRLAISFGTGPSSDIHIASVDGKHSRRITDSGTLNLRPAWSPDGSKIAFVTVEPHPDKGTVAHAYVAGAQGGGKRKLGDVTAYEVSWSPDSQYLLLESAEGVVLVSADGARTIPLSKGLVQPRDAVFAPDGREVLFRSNHEGVWHLYAVDLSGANLRRITGNLSVATFSLSPLQH